MTVDLTVDLVVYLGLDAEGGGPCLMVSLVVCFGLDAEGDQLLVIS